MSVIVEREWTVRRLLHDGVRRLQAADVEVAQREAEWLLGQLMGQPPLELYLEEEATVVPQPIVEQFFEHLEARAAGTPLQYLLGEAEFFGASFTVRPGVFIPRPETETIVEEALQALRAKARQVNRPLQLLDVGTGTGCIAVTLARAIPTCFVVGLEVSWTALGVAQQNVRRHGLTKRVQLVQGRWVESVQGQFDGMVCNPPYVPSAHVDRLPLEVRQEPRLSLDGGVSGMRDLLQVMEHVPRLIRPGGVVAFECGEEHVERLMQTTSNASWVATATTLYDLAKHPRGVLITRA